MRCSLCVHSQSVCVRVCVFGLSCLDFDIGKMDDGIRSVENLYGANAKFCDALNPIFQFIERPYYQHM